MKKIASVFCIVLMTVGLCIGCSLPNNVTQSHKHGGSDKEILKASVGDINNYPGKFDMRLNKDKNTVFIDYVLLGDEYNTTDSEKLNQIKGVFENTNLGNKSKEMFNRFLGLYKKDGYNVNMVYTVLNNNGDVFLKLQGNEKLDLECN